MFGLSAGWGKRLRWPDDYFTLSAELSYQKYILKDWQYFPVTNGNCNNISMGTVSMNNGTTVNLYVNNSLIKNIDVNASNQLIAQHFSYPLTGGTNSSIIKFKGGMKNNYGFVIDNIKITQVLDSIETSVSDFPKQVGNTTSYTIDDLSQNTNYYYTVKATNGYITTNESEAVCIKTLPEDQNTVEADEVKIYNDETINGDLRIFDGAKINGKVTVKGEISYVCKFTPSKWHSFSLPFIPKVVGGYINGIAYALRPNHESFQLKDRQ